MSLKRETEEAPTVERRHKRDRREMAGRGNSAVELWTHSCAMPPRRNASDIHIRRWKHALSRSTSPLPYRRHLQPQWNCQHHRSNGNAPPHQSPQHARLDEHHVCLNGRLARRVREKNFSASPCFLRYFIGEKIVHATAPRGISGFTLESIGFGVGLERIHGSNKKKKTTG